MNENENIQNGFSGDSYKNNPVKNKGFATASLVLGIIAIIPGCCCGYFGIIAGVLAIIFAALFLNENKDLKEGKGMAYAGLILGIVAIVFTSILLIISIYFGDVWVDLLNELNIDLDSF